MLIGTGERIAAGYGATFGLLLLWTTMSMALDARFWCAFDTCRGFERDDGRVSMMLPPSAWSPFIDNPGEPWMEGVDAPLCPGPAAATPNAVLVEAPLPSGFDPGADPADPLYACVRLGPGAGIEEVRLLRSTGSRPRDRRLIAAIVGQWRFRIDWPVDAGARWHRVRLNQGPVAGSFPAILRL